MKRQIEDIADELLVLRAQDGDKESFQLLVRRWQNRLLKHAGHVTGRPDVASEIVQESWLAVVRGIRKLKDPGAFRGWVYRIVHRRAVDWIRQRATHEAAINELQHASDKVEWPQAQRADEDDVAVLRQAISQLTADQKLLVRMFYQDNMRIREIAHSLRIPEGTVKYQMFRIRERLKTSIQTHERIAQGDRK